MKEHPILFSTPMVQAILEGRKTMTRRIVKFPNDFDGKEVYQNGSWGLKYSRIDGTIQRHFCPYGHPGDRLWVREAFAYIPTACDSTETIYRADYNDGSDIKAGVKYKPSIHMPREACRILLENTNIRVEKLHDITWDEAKAEGWGGWNNSIIPGDDPLCAGNSPRTWFWKLWNKINGTGSWDKNPLVWVIEFKRV